MASSGKTEERKVEISQIEIVTYCHATEDCSKVETAVKNIIHHSLRNSIRINYTWYDGYYGNPIGVINIKISAKPHVNAILSHLALTLDDLEKNILKTTFDLRFDSSTGRLIIRFSKQDLYHGRFRIVDSDDIVKVILSFKNARRRSDVVEYLKRINLVP